MLLCAIIVLLLFIMTFYFLFSSFSYLYISFFFFFKQKTAYEMRISDWSSDVCSSDPESHLNSDQPFSALVAGKKTAPIVWAHACVLSFQIGRASCRERVCQYV